MRRASLSLVALAALACPLVARPLAAQQHRYLSAIEYSVAIPLGDTRGYVSGTSWSGGVWESRWMDHPHTSIGALIGFNEFSRRTSGTLTFPSGAITGDQYRHIITVPILVTGHWYFSGARDDPRWYAGGGVGAVYNDQQFQLGLQDKHRTNWGIAMVPEVGLAFSAWYDTGGILSLRYHLPSTSSDMFGDGHRRLQYISLSLGFGLR